MNRIPFEHHGDLLVRGVSESRYIGGHDIEVGNQHHLGNMPIGWCSFFRLVFHALFAYSGLSLGSEDKGFENYSLFTHSLKQNETPHSNIQYGKKGGKLV